MIGDGTTLRVTDRVDYDTAAPELFAQKRVLSRKVASKIAGLLFAAVVGLIVASYPSLARLVIAAGALLLAILIQARRMGMEIWQTITLCCLTGFIVLNYGFENLSLPFGPLRFLPLGELLMGLALTLAVLRCDKVVFRKAVRQPSILCIFALLSLSLIHLAGDVPEYGLYALRDSTFVFEAFFLLLGMLWASHKQNIELLTRWLLFLFIASVIYSYSFPWADRLLDWSPTSGPFHPVPLVGNYQDIAVYLLSGSLFLIWIAPSQVNWPMWVLRALAIAELAALGILQSRTMYVGVALVFLILLVSRQTKRMSQLASLLAWSLAMLLLSIVLLSAVGWKVQGRLGPMDLSSLTEEVESIWPSSAASAELGHESDRRAWYGEVWNHVHSSPSCVLFGVGFGAPLVDFISDTGQPIRQPHNSSLNVFGRLGLLGLSIWLLFLFTSMKRLWIAAHQETRITGVSCPLPLWFFAFAVLGLLDSLVQPYFEFSHSAVPFFFLMGVALGISPEASPESVSSNLIVDRYWNATQRDTLRALP